MRCYLKHFPRRDSECCQLTERQVRQFRKASKDGSGKWYLHTTFQITKVSDPPKPQPLMAAVPRARDKSKTRPQAQMTAAAAAGKGKHKF